MSENYANDYSSVLQGAIAAGAASLFVASATGSPAAEFRIKIDDEILRVTVKAGTTFTVTRAQEGTVAAAHADGAAVQHILTAGALTLARGTTDMRAASILSTTSTTFVNVTGAAVTMTLSARRRVLVTVNASCYNSTSTKDTNLDLAIDGVRMGGSGGLTGELQITGNADVHNLGFSVITDELAPGAHTFQLMMLTGSGGTANVFNSAVFPLRISAHELP